MQYIYYFKGEISIEADDLEKAKSLAEVKFEELGKVGVKVSEAKPVDKRTGFFL